MLSKRWKLRAQVVDGFYSGYYDICFRVTLLAEPVIKVNLPMKEEKEEEEDIEALITGLYSPIFSSATSVVDSAAVSPPCPISPCPSANSSVSQANRKDSFDGTFGGLPFHIVDCNCLENDEFDIAPLEDVVSLDGMVDMQDEDIFFHIVDCNVSHA